MKVVLLENVDGVGKAGDVVEVADGYARNALFPKGQAAMATEAREQAAAVKAAHAAQAAEEELASLQHIVELVDGKIVSLKVPIGPSGKLHGAVTADSVAKAIEGALSVQLPPGSVRLQKPITEPGDQKLVLEFPHRLEAEVTVVFEGVPAPSKGT